MGKFIVYISILFTIKFNYWFCNYHKHNLHDVRLIILFIKLYLEYSCHFIIYFLLQNLHIILFILDSFAFLLIKNFQVKYINLKNLRMELSLKIMAKIRT